MGNYDQLLYVPVCVFVCEREREEGGGRRRGCMCVLKSTCIYVSCPQFSTIDYSSIWKPKSSFCYGSFGYFCWFKLNCTHLISLQMLYNRRVLETNNKKLKFPENKNEAKSGKIIIENKSKR